MPKPPTVDDVTLQDLDLRILGVNERDDAGLLETEGGGFCTAAVNMRFRSNEPETREGYFRPVPLSNTTGAGIAGVGLFVDTEGDEWVVTFHYEGPDEGSGVRSKVKFARMGNYPVETYTASPTVGLYWVVLIQAGEEMIAWREDAEPMHWGGKLDDKWMSSSQVPQPPEYPSFLAPLPQADFGIWASDRVWFPFESGVGCTGIFEPRRWDPDDPLTFYFIGGSGPVTGMVQWRLGTLIIFKETSVWALNEARGDLTEVTLELVSDQVGCIAHGTITQVGGTLLWLGRGGVYQLGEVVKSGATGGLGVSRQLSPVPLSWTVPLTMERINWRAAKHALATLADGLWYLAVPVDGMPYNSALFVYDTVAGMWQGEDRITAMGLMEFRGLTRTSIFGKESVIVSDAEELYAGGHGWHDGLVNLLPEDVIAQGDIASSFTGRGYSLEEIGLKTLKRLELVTDELGTEGVSLRAKVDGHRQEQDLQREQTRDRAKYVSWGRMDRVLWNPGDNFDEADRDDYAWVAGDTQMEETQVVANPAGPGYVTHAGNILVNITANDLPDTPWQILVPVLVGETPDIVARNITDALRLDEEVMASFGVYQYAENRIGLQRLEPAANEAGMNLALILHNGATGISPKPTSFNKVAGESGAVDVLQLGENGVPLGIHQRHKLQGTLTGVQRYVQPIVTARAGRIRIKAIRATGCRRQDLEARL